MKIDVILLVLVSIHHVQLKAYTCSCREITIEDDGTPIDLMGEYGYSKIMSCTDFDKQQCEKHCTFTGKRWIQYGDLFELYLGKLSGSEFCEKSDKDIMDKYVGIFYQLCGSQFPTGLKTKHRLCCVNKELNNCSTLHNEM